MQKTKVGILRGGIGTGYRKSLFNGGRVLSTFSNDLKDEYQSVDILIDKEGGWHINGLPASIEKIKHSADIFFNALHENSGGDGYAQKIFEDIGIKYIGSGPLASSLSNKYFLSKKALTGTGVKYLAHIELEPFDEENMSAEEYANKETRKVFEKFASPWVLKTKDRGVLGVAQSLDELSELILGYVSNPQPLVVEEFIVGKNAIVHLIEGFRNEDLYSFPPVEIVDRDNFSTPGNFSKAEKEKLTDIAKKLHHVFGARHFSSFYFTVHSKKGIYFSGFDVLPDLSKTSHFEASLRSVGASLKDFLRHVI